ncbi:MAG: sulfotransferase family protein [Acidobacteriota bacterium]
MQANSELDTAVGKVVKPVFIMGAPGSGTTLLYDTLCTHRDLAYVTLNMLRAGIHKRGRFVGEKRSALFKMQNLFHRDKASNVPHEANAFWIRYFGTYNYLTENDFTPEIAAYYRKNVTAVQNLWKRPRFINKNLQHCVRARMLDRIFPDAKFIHIIRDGRAVAYSILNKKGEANPTMFLLSLKKILGDRYRPERSELFNYGRAWAELVSKAREASVFGPDRYYELRYEDLITRPHNEIKRITDFCGVDWYGKFEKKIPKTSNMNTKWRQNADENQKKDLEESTLELRQTLGIA